jgi:hypothetical protein
MRAFAQEPKAAQRATSTKPGVPDRAGFLPRSGLNLILDLQGTIGNQAVQRLLEPDTVHAGNLTSRQRNRSVPNLSTVPLLADRLARKYPPRKSTDPLSPEYIQNEIAALTMWRGRLLDPAFVFGKGKVVSTGAGPSNHWATERQVSMVPLMQLIEYGFVRQTTCLHARVPAAKPRSSASRS